MRSSSSISSRITRAFDLFAGARACAAAVSSGRRPPRAALRQLGLEETMFDNVKIG